ncbi:hypothetical protein Tco_0646493 [Tanacetum coccineum]
MPHKPDLTFMDEIVECENLYVTTVVTPSNVKTIESNIKSAGVKNNGDTVKPKTIRKNSFRPPVIKDWNSDDENKVEIIPKDKTVSSSTEKIKLVKTTRETVEKIETCKQNKHYPRGNQRNWNNLMSQRLGSDFKMINKACYVCGSFEHLYYVCDKKVRRPIWNNSRRVNHKNFSNKITHPHHNRRFVPQALLTRSSKINTAGASVNIVGARINTVVKQVNTVGSKPTVNHPRSISNTYKKDIHKYRAVVSENKGKGANVVKASTCWGNLQQKEYKEKGVIDSGCSRHMTRNKWFPPVLNVTPMNDTGIFGNAYDDEDVGAEADLNNLKTTMNVSPIPTTRIDKDHPKDQIIGDLNLAIQTRRMTKISNEHAMVSYINKQRRINHKDYQNCLFACFVSQKEPKKVIQSLEDPS